jgi:hypothetical protein
MTLKHEFYEKPNLIAAVQAVLLYTILHIQGVGSIPKHYLKSIIITLGVCSSLQFHYQALLIFGTKIQRQ